MNPFKSPLLSIICFCFLLLLFTGCGKEEPPPKKEVVRPVKVMRVKDVRTLSNLSLPSVVRASRRAILSFKVSGPLVSFPVKEGDRVKKGQIIAQIDKRDFQTAVEEALARCRQAEEQFRRYKELYAKKQVSKADFDRFRAARDVAKARLEAAVNALKDTTLRAPFDGVVAKRYVENFQKVRAKEPIVLLQDIRTIEVVINVPELVMAALKEGGTQKVTARFEAIPGKEFPLTLKEFSTQADPATRTYEVVFTMKQPKEALILPGMTATVTATSAIASEEKNPAILVPAWAVIGAPGEKSFVWVFDEKTSTVHKREVKIGPLKGSQNIKILDGLKTGELVVVAGCTQLKEGQKVRLWERQREGIER